MVEIYRSRMTNIDNRQTVHSQSNTKTPQKRSIKQRLRTELRRPIGATNN